MKAPLSKNIKKIFQENKYDHWIYRTSILPRELREEGFDISVRLEGADGTELRYILDGYKDVTDIINRSIEKGIHLAKAGIEI